MGTSIKMLAVAMCAMLAVATAYEQDAPKAEPAHEHYDYYGKDRYEGPPRYETPHYDYPHYSTKTITLYGGPSTPCNGDATTCAAVVTITRTMYADAALTKPVGDLYQYGVVASTGADLAKTRIVYQQSFRFTGANGFGEGTIQTQGDDTGLDDPTFTNRAIIGGTGAFTAATGYLSRGGNPATATPGPYTFYLVNWKGNGYGY